MPVRRKYSRQRAAVLGAVRHAHGHPSAEEVHRIVRRTMPSVALGTVYRNLQILVEAGELGIVEHTPAGITRYDKMTRAHHHFYCLRCGAIVDIPAAFDAALERKVARLVRGTVHEQRTAFYGTCGTCLAQLPDATGAPASRKHVPRK